MKNPKETIQREADTFYCGSYRTSDTLKKKNNNNPRKERLNYVIDIMDGKLVYVGHLVNYSDVIVQAESLEELKRKCKIGLKMWLKLGQNTVDQDEPFDCIEQTSREWYDKCGIKTDENGNPLRKSDDVFGEPYEVYMGIYHHPNYKPGIIEYIKKCDMPIFFPDNRKMSVEEAVQALENETPDGITIAKSIIERALKGLEKLRK